MTGCPAFLRAFALLLLIVVPTATVAAPVAASRNASGTVSVLKSLSVINQTELDFGRLVVSGAGTAVINPVTGAITTTGMVVPNGADAHQATFTATGSRNSVVNIRIPQQPVTLTRVGGTQTMTVSNWTLDGNSNRKIPMNNAFNFGVGATLTVAAGQAEGVYTGTFSVTVQYP